MIPNQRKNNDYLIDFNNLKKELEIELERILYFWSNQVVDLNSQNFIGKIDCFGVKFPKESKSVILTSRMLWTFSKAYNFTKKEVYIERAHFIYKYLIENFWDSKNGGLIWEVDYQGIPLNEKKQAYAQGFGIYGLSEYFAGTGNEESLHFANKLFDIFESHFLDSKYGGYIEALDSEWNPILDLRLSDKDANYPKTMNTHLHIIEPYTNLYKVAPSKRLKKRIEDLIQIFLKKIIDPATGHFNLFFDMDWQVQSNIESFGHDIEGAWLLNESANIIENNELIEATQKAALKLVNITIDGGMDNDGSLFNEKEGSHLDKDKHWWPQAEAMVGFMDAWETSNDDQYLQHLVNSWQFIKNNLIDFENGEWFWRINEFGDFIKTDDKVGFWKCPYHNSRAIIEVLERIEKI